MTPVMRMRRDSLVLLLGGACVYLLLALFSFNALDPSPLSFSIPSRPITNLAGSFGAHFAALAFFYLGWLAYLAPLMFFIGSAKLLRSEGQHFLRQVAMLGAPFILWLSICGFVFVVLVCLGLPATTTKTVLGWLGATVTAWVAKKIGTSGVLCLSVAAAGIAVSFLTQIPALQPLRWLRTYLAKRREKSKSAPLEPAPPPPVAAEPAAVANEESLVEDIAITPEEPFSYSVTPFQFGGSRPVSRPALQETTLSKDAYDPPPIGLFRRSASRAACAISAQEAEQTAAQLVKTFAEFGVGGQVVGTMPGPVVTVYEFQPDAGIKLAKILALADDLALNLRVDSVFIMPLPGKRAIGIQVPNSQRESVLLGDMFYSQDFSEQNSLLPLAIGKTIDGKPFCADLSQMPHLLVAGSTGSGKSVCINSMICSILMKSSPQKVRLLMVDPKVLELSVYEGIPHLLMPVITDPTEAAAALKWATIEMERRYKIMQYASVRHISGFNQYWQNASDEAKQLLEQQIGASNLEPLPYLVIVIDELADLMLTAPREVESNIQRLAQKARACGIHMILATQRPSVDVITGVIKANLPCRISFQCVSRHDSRTIIDQIGADKLLGRGDMLLQKPGQARLERIQGAFISDEEVVAVVNHLKTEKPTGHFDQATLAWIQEEAKRGQAGGDELHGLQLDSDDSLFEDAVQVARSQGQISASYLQRQLKIGYNRAARLVETMEARGLIAKAEGVKPRRWLGGGSDLQSASLHDQP